MKDIQIHKDIGQKMVSDKYIIICTMDNPRLVESIKKEMEQGDEIIVANIPKFPTRFFEKVFYNVNNTFDWLMLINNNSRYYSHGYLTNIKKNKIYDGIVFKRTDDIDSEEGIVRLSNKLVMSDDSICIPMKLFKGFRDISPQTPFSGIIKSIARIYPTYGDSSRNIVGYDEIIKQKRELAEIEEYYNKELTNGNKPGDISKHIYEKDIQKRKVAISTFWYEEIKKKKEKEERLMRTVPNAFKKINKNGTISVVSNVITNIEESNINNNNYVGDWNTWMETKG